jgi:hypothetical protein
MPAKEKQSANRRFGAPETLTIPQQVYARRERLHEPIILKDMPQGPPVMSGGLLADEQSGSATEPVSKVLASAAAIGGTEAISPAPERALEPAKTEAAIGTAPSSSNAASLAISQVRARTMQQAQPPPGQAPEPLNEFETYFSV